jgi:hypothetical protein
MCGSGVDVASSLLLISAILMAVGEQPFHLSRCPNFRNRLTGIYPPRIRELHFPEVANESVVRIADFHVS